MEGGAVIVFGQQCLEDVELDDARLGLRLPLAEIPGPAGAEVVDGGQDGAGPARQVRRRGRPERIPVTCYGRRPQGRRRRGRSLRGMRPPGLRWRRGRRVQPRGSGRIARPADRAGRGAVSTGRARRTHRGQARYGAPGDDGAGAQRHEHDPDGRSRRPGTGAPGAPGVPGAPGTRVPASSAGDRRPDHSPDREPCSVRPAGRARR